MTDKQLIIMLSLLKAKIADNNMYIYKELVKDKLEAKYMPMIMQNESELNEMIATLKPTIKICRCGTEMPGQFKLCHTCRKKRGFAG